MSVYVVSPKKPLIRVGPESGTPLSVAATVKVCVVEERLTSVKLPEIVGSAFRAKLKSSEKLGAPADPLAEKLPSGFAVRVGVSVTTSPPTLEVAVRPNAGGPPAIAPEKALLANPKTSATAAGTTRSFIPPAYSLRGRVGGKNP